ncbi:MAG: DEAD/DEAH box helicase family protein [Selenomonadaceae bacterium]|nr:DEAD/DEAH box helicase family protein [Selenomonadaceae bacterium]
MEEIKLRPYQAKFIIDVYHEFATGHKRICGVAPCGAGKTIMTGWLIREFMRQGKRVIFFVHRHELIEQTSKTFTQLGIEHGIIAAGMHTQYELPVQIASVQTLARRLNSVPAPDLLVCDECHHILAETYKRIIGRWEDALLLGVTATPQRMGGINLGDVFTSLVEAPSTKELIDLGNLTKFKYFAPDENIDFKKFRVKFGEYINSDLDREMSKKKIIGGIVEHYKKLANGKSAICYCVNVKHSKKIAAAFNAAGISAEHCDGETNKTVRAQIVEDFRQGKIKVLCNAELFGEGFDVPNMQAVILARPTKSLTLFTQQSLRPLRPDPNEPNKVAVIIDHVKNYSRFGLPDAPRRWSLDPNPPKQEGEAPLKACPVCDEVVHAAYETCPYCGYKFISEEEKEEQLREQKGKLNEIKRVQVAAPPRKRVKHKPKTPEEFLEIAKERDYKIGWVAMHSLTFAESYEDCLHIAEICGYKPGWAWYKWKEIQEAKDKPDEEKQFPYQKKYSAYQRNFRRDNVIMI